MKKRKISLKKSKNNGKMRWMLNKRSGRARWMPSKRLLMKSNKYVIYRKKKSPNLLTTIAYSINNWISYNNSSHLPIPKGNQISTRKLKIRLIQIYSFLVGLELAIITINLQIRQDRQWYLLIVLFKIVNLITVLKLWVLNRVR